MPEPTYETNTETADDTTDDDMGHAVRRSLNSGTDDNLQRRGQATASDEQIRSSVTHSKTAKK